MKKDVIVRFKEIHGDKYDYSEVEYKKMSEKVEIICPIHGSFFQTPHAHLKGQGCPLCALEKRSRMRMDDVESFIRKARKIHGDKYDYSKVEYIDSKTKVCIICPIHGEFWQTPNNHLTGKGCSKCYDEVRGDSQRLSIKEFIKKARKIHGNKYDYSKVIYVNNRTKVCIICPIHGEFWQTPDAHLRGEKCPVCSKEVSAEKRKITTGYFIQKARKIHGDKYGYSNVEYCGALKKVKIICPIHGEFEQVASYHLSGNGCPQCAMEMTESSFEREISEFIKENYDGDIVRNDRKTLNNNRELDIYIPSKALAFEFDGLYWHSTKNCPQRDYHLLKTKECNKKGVRLIHIFEDEWIYKKEIVKSMILSLLNKPKETVSAKNCFIKELNSKIAYKFLEENNIYGCCSGKYKFGLFYNNELVSIAVFRHLKNADYRLVRFSDKNNIFVENGLKALICYFLETVKPKNIIAELDRRLEDGEAFKSVGFNLIKEKSPCFCHVVNNKRIKPTYFSRANPHKNKIFDCGRLILKIEKDETAVKEEYKEKKRCKI